MNPTKRNKLLLKLRNFLKLIIFFVIVIDITLALRKFVFNFVSIDGQSMEPTFKNNDLIVVSRLDSSFGWIDRNDVIVFKPYTYDNPNTAEDESKELYIKRVIGLPGETITITQDLQLVIVDKNGKQIDFKDKHCHGSMTRGIDLNPYDDNRYETITLGKDEYFVLGDNRSVSRDSRSDSVGPINKNTIVGVYKFGF